MSNEITAELDFVFFYKGKKFMFAMFVETARIKKMIKNNKYRSVPGGDNNTSWGWLIPIGDILNANN